MSKYKVGDVAALFSKPKEPTTESGKKLQSLFKEFQSKNKKGSSQSSEKAVNNLNQGSEEVQNQRKSKKEKKRKFSTIIKEEPDEVNNTKKFKKTKVEATNSTELNGKHLPAEVNNDTKNFKKIKSEATDSIELRGKHFSAEMDFPRKKKSSKGRKNSLKNNTSNSFADDDASSDDIKQAQNADFKSKMKSSDKKEISKFIRKSMKQMQAAVNGDIKSKDNDIVSHKDKYGKGTLFKEDHEEFGEQSAKKQKKKKHSNDNFVQNKKFSDAGENENKTLFKKSFGEKLHPQPIMSGKEEPDFIKLPDLKSEDAEEKLSRTLFVANLPINIRRKQLQTLFSPFGEIEHMRYRGVETDKAKIFKENGPQTLNPKNYAADSIPAFIIFSNRESAVKALSLSGSLFQGRHITVDFALPAGTKKMYDDKRSIFIGNLPFDCQDESIWEAFSECGRIESVRIVRDKQTGIGKGFGYVLFSTVQSKENALGLEDIEINGRTIRIKPVDSNPSKQKKGNNKLPAKINTFKSQAIRIKKKNKDSTSRKSVKKIMMKQKNLHQKKKNANILGKAVKF